MLKYYRPAGNRINLTPAPFNADRFSPLSMHFYQSGTAALAAAIIAACKLKGNSSHKNEILLPAYACPDLISAVLYAEATPVLIDLQQNSCFLSLDELENKITPNAVAIIAVNFLGLPEQIKDLKKICHQNKLVLINDSAQWFPKKESKNNWPGDFNIVSFGRGKPVNLLHGGAVITNSQKRSAALAQVASSAQNSESNYMAAFKIAIYNLVIQPFFYGILTRLPGLNIGETIFKQLTTISKMNSYYHSLLQNNIKSYGSIKTRHEIIHQKLRELDSPAIIDLYPTGIDHDKIALLRYPILITDKTMRDSFLSATEHLGVSNMYKRPLNEISGLENLLSAQNTYPNASDFADHLVTLPTHAGIPPSVIPQIFSTLKILLKENT